MVDFGSRPIGHRLLNSSDDPDDVYPLSLHTCMRCGLIQILAPVDPDILYEGYNYIFSSWKPEPHLEDELDLIFNEGDPKSAFDIGCNDGRFLSALRQRGVDSCVGLEPNSISATKAQDKDFHVYEAMASIDVARKVVDAFGKFDLIVSRQVLEHVTDLNAYFACAHHLLDDDGFFFLDIPNFEFGLRLADCSVIWEGHVNYFTESTLKRVLRLSGFEPVAIHHHDYSGGTLSVIARDAFPVQPNQLPPLTDAKDDSEDVKTFGVRLREYRNRLVGSLASARNQGFSVVIYGVGARGCAVVNGLDLGEFIDFAIDDLPERQWKYMPGSRLHICPSERLSDMDGSVVCLLAVNNESEDKVAAKARVLTNQPIHFVSLLSPKDIWRELEHIESL